MISLNRVGERIIGPFHIAVKILSNYLDNRHANHQYFCLNSDNQIQSTQFPNTKMAQYDAKASGFEF